MASSVASASAASAVAKPPSTTLPPRTFNYNTSHSSLSFRLPNKPKLRIFTRGVQPVRKHSTFIQAQLNEDPVDVPTVAKITSESDVLASDGSAKPSSDQSSKILATEESISEFITQVSSLVKLVDSRDIVELQLKQLDCEVVIRKKEALPQPPPPAVGPMMYAPPPSVAQSAPPPMPAALPAPASASSAPSSPPPAKSATSSLPTLKCPMAGTFYRSPGPGEPPFVKVGDKVQKGQVLCIIEAMKLMNEIEADRSGTIVEVLAEDGKPVSVDTPLFVIQP
ncbi:biotin carboxyl carrier protein of acetyl-CoA carboxylase [Cucumis melo var. makuwa]|uniref:Biotin carboxyl carrier protein of acetyl-CoA carboxylase n=2 Tax=Cucumis melo TaxID=3656 RepID=A0A5D3BDP1_CUCMM|nr:biotin carboxyl carrier protein of acetyl-CoA carboxylase, chloroplastic isoform X2 [Cucumis melo]TYJ97892.1 biotin carboxyl carrier protein of acetyl-CoA carboxylase [Cucumis melo var. makuwa]